MSRPGLQPPAAAQPHTAAPAVQLSWSPPPASGDNRTTGRELDPCPHRAPAGKGVSLASLPGSPLAPVPPWPSSVACKLRPPSLQHEVPARDTVNPERLARLACPPPGPGPQAQPGHETANPSLPLCPFFPRPMRGGSHEAHCMAKICPLLI